MDTTLVNKLARVKAALQKTIELAEKATAGPWVVGREAYADPLRITTKDSYGKLIAQIETIPETDLRHCRDASYIAHACNLGAATAKALLVTLGWLEFDLSNLDPVDVRCGLIRTRLTSILAIFPDKL